MVKETKHDGSTVRHEHHLADYMPALAVALQRAIGRPETRWVRFLTDFVDMCLKAGTGMFPSDISKAACEMRVMRLLASPVEVDGVVLALESMPKRRMRQKSKQLVARVGHLTESAPGPSVSQALSPHAAAPATFDLEALKTAVIEDVMARLEMLYGRTPASGHTDGSRRGLSIMTAEAPSEDVLMALRQRIGRGEINLENLADAVRLVSPNLVYKSHATVIKPDDGDED